MKSINPNYPATVKKDRRHIALSRKDPPRKLGVSYATVNRWENGQAKPSKLARVHWMRSVRGCRKKDFLFCHQSKTVSDPLG